jgi:hypothetical protein
MPYCGAAFVTPRSTSVRQLAETATSLRQILFASSDFHFLHFSGAKNLQTRL